MSEQRKITVDRKALLDDDAPIMRSVTMVHGHSAVAAFPPPMPISSRPIESKSKTLETFLQPKPTKSDQRSWKPTALALPTYYKLERNRVVVVGAAVQEVADRIAECIRKESIAATFDDQQGCARLETANCVKLCVRLWNINGQITVECQRTAGCCFLYQQIAKAVLRAASGQVEESLAPLPMPKCVPQLPAELWEQATVEDLDLACASLRSKRLDSHVLALESLSQLSQASMCRAFCANHILSREGGHEILDNLVSVIQCSGASNEEECLTDMEKDQVARMHRFALNILGNCLDTIRETGTLASTVLSLPELTSEATVFALTKDVALAKIKPHEAAAACRCLHALVQSGCVAVPFDDLRSATHTASESCRHASLEEESRKLLNDL